VSLYGDTVPLKLSAHVLILHKTAFHRKCFTSSRFCLH